jgi:hypothetical protein
MAKYRKKPVIVEVEAQQFDPEQPRSKWPFGVEWEPPFLDQDGSRLGGFHKLTLFGGFQFIRAGDWVVYAGGRRKVVDDKTFRETYEAVEGLTTAAH